MHASLHFVLLKKGTDETPWRVTKTVCLAVIIAVSTYDFRARPEKKEKIVMIK
jgi:hypothetical protein